MYDSSKDFLKHSEVHKIVNCDVLKNTVGILLKVFWKPCIIFLLLSSKRPVQIFFNLVFYTEVYYLVFYALVKHKIVFCLFKTFIQLPSSIHRESR